MNRPPAIIVDVTQLVHWPGALTGIPRVMYELAVRYRTQAHSNARFVSWVKELKTFCEIDLDATLAQRGNGIVYLYGQETPAQSSHAGAISSSGSSATLSQRNTLHKNVRRVLKAGIRRTAYIHPKIAATLEERAKAVHMSTFRQMAFQEGDTLFIPWGEWWDKNFLVRLEELHVQNVHITTIIHDIGPMVVPHLSGHSTESLTEYCERIVPLADMVLVVSKNTKKDLTEWLESRNLTVPRIGVFRLGEDFKVAKPSKPTDPAFVHSGLRGHDYAMCVGTIEAKKNHMLFFYVYTLARQRGIDLPPLVVVGRRGWKTDNMFDIVSNDPHLKNKIIFLTDTSDEALSWLYDHCMFTVLPSFYEGWGIPIAESIARGVPCLCSNTTSMVEIAPGLTEHFSPASPEECLAGMQRWSDHKTLEAARKRLSSYRPTSWDESFNAVSTYLKEL